MSEFLKTSGVVKRLVEKTGISMEVVNNFFTVLFIFLCLI